MNCNLISAVLFFAKLLECAVRTVQFEMTEMVIYEDACLCFAIEDEEVQSRH